MTFYLLNIRNCLYLSNISSINLCHLSNILSIIKCILTNISGKEFLGKQMCTPVKPESVVQ